MHVISPFPAALSDAEVPRLTEDDYRERKHALVRERQKELENLIPPEFRETNEAEPVIREGPPFDRIYELARERQADLVVLGAHGHGRSDFGWIGSTCHKVMRAAPRPVLVVRGSG